MAKPKRGLGKGLDALFFDNGTEDVAVSTLPIGDIEPNAAQPRREFSPEALSSLAESIREHGVLQPLVVRPLPSGRYQIVAGERRWRASRIAGLSELPVIVRELNDRETFEVALVENLVREDLNPVEEAEGYRTLAEEFSMTQEQIAARVGRSRPAVANALRLLSLPAEVLTLLENSKISVGHAKVLLSLPEKAAVDLAKQTAAEGLSVRQVEALCKKALSEPKEAEKAPPSPSFYRETELALRDVLSRRVKVSAKPNGKGEITIEFYSKDELTDLARRLAAEADNH